MNSCRFWWLVTVAGSLALAAPVRGDSLESLRGEVRTPKPKAEHHQHHPQQEQNSAGSGQNPYNNPYHQHDESSDNVSGELLGAALIGTGIAVTAPFWGPQMAIEHGRSGAGLFNAYPYEDGRGFMTFDDRLASDTPEYAFAWATRLRGEYGDDFDSLQRWSGHLLAEHVSRFGFDGAVNYWQQDLGGGAGDELWTGDANLVVRFAQSERVQLRSGVGMNWLADERDADFGFNFTYGGDYYLLDPFVLSAELDAGWLGEAWLVHLRATVGVQVRQVELFTGYDYWEIGQTQLDGWTAGFRLVF